MLCPACRQNLTGITVSGIKVDVCQAGCRGVWLDNYELEKMDEQHESAGEALLEHVASVDSVVDKSTKHKCPRCDDAIMRRFFYSVRKEIEIDDCPACGGTWLDTNELARIRAEHTTQADRQKAASEYFAKLFDTGLAAEAKKGQEDLARAQKFARAFKYLLPSYWIPGKQDGGAF